MICGGGYRVVEVRVALILVVIVAICVFVFDLGVPFLADKPILLKNFLANVETIKFDPQSKVAEAAELSRTIDAVSTLEPLSLLNQARPLQQECWKGVPVYNGINCMCYFEVIGFAKCGSTFVVSMMHQLPQVRSSRFRAAKVMPHFVSRVSQHRDYKVTLSLIKSWLFQLLITIVLSNSIILSTNPTSQPMLLERRRSWWAKASRRLCTMTRDLLSTTRPSIQKSSNYYHSFNHCHSCESDTIAQGWSHWLEIQWPGSTVTMEWWYSITKPTAMAITLKSGRGRTFNSSKTASEAIVKTYLSRKATNPSL